jgi:flagellar protein FliO/FliZ
MRTVLPIITMISLMTWAVPMAHAAAPFQEPMAGGYLGQMFFGLLVVVALIFVLSFFVKRYGQIGTTSELKFKVLTSLALSQRERLVLVQIGDKQVVLGVAPGHVSQVMELDQPLVDEAAISSMPSSKALDWTTKLFAVKRGVQQS